jgi:hypothetical protein
VSEEAGLEGWHRFIGRWETEGAHPMLPGEAIRGTSTFEWLDGRRFVIWRSHYDHSQIPDAITIIGVTDGQPSMQRPRSAIEGREYLGGRSRSHLSEDCVSSIFRPRLRSNGRPAACQSLDRTSQDRVRRAEIGLADLVTQGVGPRALRPADLLKRRVAPWGNP